MNSSVSDFHEFMLLVARAFHRYGAAAHQIEAALESLARKFCERGEFFVTPTVIVSSIKMNGQWHTKLLRLPPGGVDLGRLSMVDHIGDRVIHSDIGMEKGLEELNYVGSLKLSIFQKCLKVLCYVIASIAFIGLIGTSQSEVLCVGFVAFVTATILESTANIPKADQVVEAVVSFLASFLAYGAASYFDGSISPEKIVLASLIVLIPGLSITVSLVEISTHNWLAGSARLVGALAQLLKITFGVVIGGLSIRKLVAYEPNVSILTHIELPEPLLIVLLSLSVSFLFNNLFRDYIWVLIGAMGAYYSVKIGGVLLEKQLGLFWGGVFLAMYSNAFARLFHRPALTILTPGLIPMVPGSIGYRSFNLLFSHNFTGATATIFELVIAAVSLVAGLTIGNLMVHPRRSL